MLDHLQSIPKFLARKQGSKQGRRFNIQLWVSQESFYFRNKGWPNQWMYNVKGWKFTNVEWTSCVHLMAKENMCQEQIGPKKSLAPCNPTNFRLQKVVQRGFFKVLLELKEGFAGSERTMKRIKGGGVSLLRSSSLESCENRSSWKYTSVVPFFHAGANASAGTRLRMAGWVAGGWRESCRSLMGKWRVRGESNCAK